ncbi:hypothetical protein Fmac_031544 [Flemingia macrophylla]|uniref:Uncharacterized protein n=1 Tax=Flemingia macrophylla TaxID=520843 RepID=A0ABD1L2D5_9FABA
MSVFLWVFFFGLPLLIFRNLMYSVLKFDAIMVRAFDFCWFVRICGSIWVLLLLC